LAGALASDLMIACRHVATVLVTMVALTACSSAPSDPSDRDDATARPSATTAATTAPPSADSSSYVALGDSYTAGPGIDAQQAGTGLCQRSDHNWPTLVAAATRLDLTDVSCVGATTADLASTIASGVLDTGARLVTVSTGGNDSGLFSSLITACAGGGADCQAFVDSRVPGILAQTSGDIATLLDTVKADVPGATVLLVGYPRIAPETGGCATIGISDSGAVLSAETALDTSLAAAARRADVTYVSLRDASLGHDACAGSEAWTNGRSAAPGDGIMFHPTARGMAGVADAVAHAAAAAGVR
jgi:lysophospholipase L1-like esterase